MSLPCPDKSGLAMTGAEGLGMTSVDVIEQPWIICVDFFHATANFENKIDKAIATLSFSFGLALFL